MIKWIYGVVALVLLTPAARAETRLKLVLFSTPWCSDCLREIPELHRQLKEKLGDSYADLDVTLLAQTGKKSTDKPTDASAAEMGKQFGVEFKTAADPWRWQTFRKYFPTATMGIPASVVLDLEGNVLKACKPEGCSPHELSTFIAEKMKTARAPFSLYLVGEAVTTDANGKWLESSVYLIERKVIPAESRVEISSIEIGADKKVTRRTTLMNVTGNHYVVTDPKKSYEGTGSFTGKGWKWETWNYAVNFPNGGALRGNDELTDTALKMRKRYFDAEGKPKSLISADFAFLSPKTFEILAAKLAP